MIYFFKLKLQYAWLRAADELTLQEKHTNLKVNNKTHSSLHNNHKNENMPTNTTCCTHHDHKNVEDDNENEEDTEEEEDEDDGEEDEDEDEEEEIEGIDVYTTNGEKKSIGKDLENDYKNELKTILNKSNLLNLKETTKKLTNNTSNISSLAPFSLNPDPINLGIKSIDNKQSNDTTSSSLSNKNAKLNFNNINTSFIESITNNASMAMTNNKENDLFEKNVDKSFLDSIVNYTNVSGVGSTATPQSKSITNYQKRKANRSSIAFYQHLKKSNKTKTLKSMRSKQQQQQQQIDIRPLMSTALSPPPPPPQSLAPPSSSQLLTTEKGGDHSVTQQQFNPLQFLSLGSFNSNQLENIYLKN